MKFNSIDPVRPYFREKLDSTRQRLEAIRVHLKALHMKVVLRDPLPEEVDRCGAACGDAGDVLTRHNCGIVKPSEITQATRDRISGWPELGFALSRDNSLS